MPVTHRDLKSFTPVAGALYFTDNGRVLCAEHLGITARMTGRDLSGQRIARISAADASDARDVYDMALVCESCQLGRPVA